MCTVSQAVLLDSWPSTTLPLIAEQQAEKKHSHIHSPFYFRKLCSATLLGIFFSPNKSALSQSYIELRLY